MNLGPMGMIGNFAHFIIVARWWRTIQRVGILQMRRVLFRLQVAAGSLFFLKYLLCRLAFVRFVRAITQGHVLGGGETQGTGRIIGRIHQLQLLLDWVCYLFHIFLTWFDGVA